jgi:hypothetical protein
MEKFIACIRTILLGCRTLFVGRAASGERNAFSRRAKWATLATILGFAPVANALQLTVAWDIVATGELGFNVERSTDGTNFVQIATVAAGVSSYTDINLSAGTYWYRVRAFNATSYSAYSNTASTQTAVSAPSFTTQPASVSAASGSTVSFSATASGSPVPTLQWKKNGTAISGATTSTLTLNSISSADAGTYTVEASNSAGTVTSIGAVLTLTTINPVAPPPVELISGSRIRNLSASAVPGKGNQSIKMDFIVKGSGMSGLVRAIGPGLDAFTSSATAADPKITLTSAGATLAANDNWGGSTALASVFTQVGAFPLAANSKDAALVHALDPNSYSAAVSGKTGGLAMIEVYDVGATAGRLSAIKVAAPVGTGDQRLVGGFTITGSEPLRVLIRAVGPGLDGRGILVDPQLELHRGSTFVVRNDNWDGTAALINSFELAGATSLPSSSKDAAVEVTLEPGTYTATISGVNNTTGYAQLEVYEVR